jgi:hypothetical protein
VNEHVIINLHHGLHGWHGWGFIRVIREIRGHHWKRKMLKT